MEIPQYEETQTPDMVIDPRGLGYLVVHGPSAAEVSSGLRSIQDKITQTRQEEAAIERSEKSLRKSESLFNRT